MSCIDKYLKLHTNASEADATMMIVKEGSCVYENFVRRRGKGKKTLMKEREEAMAKEALQRQQEAQRLYGPGALGIPPIGAPHPQHVHPGYQQGGGYPPGPSLAPPPPADPFGYPVYAPGPPPPHPHQGMPGIRTHPPPPSHGYYPHPQAHLQAQPYPHPSHQRSESSPAGYSSGRGPL